MAGGEVISELIVKLVADVSQFKSQMAGIGRDVNTQFTGATNDVKKGINDLNAIPISPNLKTVKNDLNDIKGVESFAPHITSGNTLKGTLSGTAREARGVNMELRSLGLGGSPLVGVVSASSRLGASLANNSQSAGILATTLGSLGPIAVPLAVGIAAVGVGIGAMALGSETFRKTLQGAVEVAGKLKDHLSTAFDDLKSGKINDALNEVKTGFAEFANSIMNMKIDWRKIFGEVGTAVKSINWGEIGDAIKHGLETLGGGLLDLGGALVDALTNTDWGAVGRAIISGVGSVLAGSVELGIKFREAFLKIDWGSVVLRLWAAFQDINIKIRDALINALKTADYGSIGNAILNGIKSVIGTGIKLTIDFLVGAGKAIYDFIMGTSVGKALKAPIDFLIGAGKAIYDFITGAAVGKAINAIINFLAGVGKALYDFISSPSASKAINAVINFLAGVGKAIYDFVTGAAGGSKTISATIDFLVGVGKTIYDFVTGNAQKTIDATINFLTGIGKAIADFLGLGGGSSGGSTGTTSKDVSVNFDKGNDPAGIFDMISGTVKKAISVTVNLIQGVASTLGAIGGAIMGGAGDLWDFVLGKSNPPDKTITVVTKESGLDQIMQTLNNMTGQEHDVNITVKCDTGPAQAAINAIAGPPPINIPIHVDTGPAQGAINAVTRASPVEIPIHVDTGPAQGAINAIVRGSPVEIPLHCDTGPAQSAINAIARQNAVEIPVHVDTGPAQAAINAIQGKEVTVTITTVHVEKTVKAAAGGVFSAQSGGHMAIIGEGGEAEAVIPQRYWGGVDPGIINALPHYAAGGVIAPGSGAGNLVGPGGTQKQIADNTGKTADNTAKTAISIKDLVSGIGGILGGLVKVVTALGNGVLSVMRSVAEVAALPVRFGGTQTSDNYPSGYSAKIGEDGSVKIVTALSGTATPSVGNTVTGSVQQANVNAIKSAQSIFGAVTNVASGLVSGFTDIGSSLGGVLDKLLTTTANGAAQTTTAVNNGTTSTCGAVTQGTNGTTGAVQSGTSSIVSALSSLSSGSGLGGIFSSITSMLGGLVTIVEGIFSLVTDVYDTMVEQAQPTSGAFNYGGSYYTTHSTKAPVDYGKLIGDVGTIASGGMQVLSGGIGLIGGVASMAMSGGGSMLGVLGLQSGGIVTKPTYAHIAEHGPEAVVPLAKYGGGKSYEIHVHVNSDVPDTTIDLIARKVTTKIQHMEFLQGGR